MAITSLSNPSIDSLSYTNLPDDPITYSTTKPKITVVGTSMAVHFDTPDSDDYKHIHVFVGDSNLDVATASTIDFQYTVTDSGVLQSTPFSPNTQKYVIIRVADLLGEGSSITQFNYLQSTTASQITFLDTAGSINTEILVDSGNPAMSNNTGEVVFEAVLKEGGSTYSGTINSYAWYYRTSGGTRTLITDNPTGTLATQTGDGDQNHDGSDRVSAGNDYDYSKLRIDAASAILGSTGGGAATIECDIDYG